MALNKQQTEEVNSSEGLQDKEKPSEYPDITEWAKMVKTGYDNLLRDYNKIVEERKKILDINKELLEALELFISATNTLGSNSQKTTINTQRHADAMQFGEKAIQNAKNIKP